MCEVRIASGEDAAAEASSRGDLILLIDALRATTTMVTALAHGIRHIIPVAHAEECIGELTAGERKGRKLPGMDLGNSPRSFLSKEHEGKVLTLTTTNGTRCLHAAANHRDALVLIAAMVNLNAAARDAKRFATYYRKNITIIASGRLHEEAVEDNLTAGLLKEAILKGALPEADAQTTAQRLDIFLHGGSGENLIRLGHRADIHFCVRQDLYEVTPIFLEGKCRLIGPHEPPISGFIYPKG
ncbi:MAG: 2-phosphosulfolactate phosphatase [Verrucomicrobiales bacterium]